MIQNNGNLQPFSMGNLPSIAKTFPMEIHTTILQQLNPLEHISNAISRICYYKEQCKALELESLKIKEQASFMHLKIDTNFKKAMY